MTVKRFIAQAPKIKEKSFEKKVFSINSIVTSLALLLIALAVF